MDALFHSKLTLRKHKLPEDLKIPTHFELQYYLNKKVKIEIEHINAKINSTLIIKRAKKIIDLVNDIQEFANDINERRAVLSHKRKDGTYGYSQDSRENWEHLRDMVEGRERSSEADNVWSIKFTFYYSRRRVIAYVNVGGVVTHLNTKYSNRKRSEIGCTLVHEQDHLMSGNHSFRRSTLWPFTRPYSRGKSFQFWYFKKHNITTATPGEVAFVPKPSLWRRVRGFFRRVFRR